MALLGAAGCAPSSAPPAEWEAGDGFRSLALNVSRGEAGFQPVEDSGIDFIGGLSDTAFVSNRHRVNGAGVAIGDVDGDGLPDVFLAGLEVESRLYRNLGGFRFEDMTESAGVAFAGEYTTGAAFLDADGDGDLDLTVTTLDGPSRLLLNDGAGVYKPDAEWPGLGAGPRGGTSITAADIDGDTDLDIYVTNYKRHTVKDLFPQEVITFEETVIQDGGEYRIKPPFDAHYRVELQGNRLMRYEYGEADMLALNQGGRFEDATTRAFPTVPEDWGLAAQFRDHDGDGDPDLYVANDFESPDHLWWNNGAGQFSAAPVETMRHTSQSSMSVDGSDVDRDGDVDLFVTEMLSRTHSRRLRQVGNPPPIIPGIGETDVVPQVMHNTMQMAATNPWTDRVRYSEAAWALEVAASEWSWTSLFLDVDFDGWEDLLVTTGHSYDAMDLDAQMAGASETGELLRFPDLDLNNVAFRNVNGVRFEDMADGWGIGIEPDVTHGMAAGDLDGDGDLDLITNRLNGVAGVFRNASGAPRIAVRLKGLGANTHGIGSRIRVTGGGMTQEKEILAGGFYLSGNEPMTTFAALADSMTLTVLWRSGREQSIPVTPNRLYEITESSGPIPPRPALDLAAPPYQLTELAAHTEAPFEDRARQPLLTRRLSQEGSFAASGDLNGDGLTDFVIGAGHAGKPLVYLSQGESFQPIAPDKLPTAIGDWAGVAILSDGLLAVAVSGYETDRNGALLTYRLNDSGLTQVGQLDLGAGSPGSMVSADFGGADLFVAMRFLPDRYPESAPSLVLERTGDSFREVSRLNAGMVSGAAAADVDGDGDQDLALTQEWGAVRLFLNDGAGTFTDASANWALNEQVGLWRSATWGDVNGDDRPDLITTNWGWNSPFGRVGAPDYPGRGIRLYVGDFDRNGSPDPVEAEYAPELRAWGPVMKQMNLIRGLRYVSRRVSSAMGYARMPIEEVLGPPAEGATIITALQLGHVVWINRGDRFEPLLLPEEAQWAPASGALVRDLNGDGYADILLSQNFFPVLPEDATRQDAGSGLVLLGDGTGAFGKPSWQLGLTGDGRAVVDLETASATTVVMTQNAAPAYLVTFR